MNDAARARYYEERQKADDLVKIANKCLCECGAILMLSFKADADGVNIHHLCCGNGHVDPAVVPQASVYELWKEGKVDVPVYVANKYEDQLRKEIGQMTTVPARTEQIEALAIKPVITEQEAMTLLNVVWPDAPMAAKQRAAIICRQYKLNPMMRHVALLRFESKRTGKVTWEPVLEIKATRIIAQREGRYSYLDGPRMMTDHEQDSINGQIDETKWWSITVIKDKDGNLYRGYGSWPKAEAAYGADKGNTQQNMAHIRSERQALAKFAPGKLPEDIEVVEGGTVEVREITAEASELAEATKPPLTEGMMATRAGTGHAAQQVRKAKTSEEEIRQGYHNLWAKRLDEAKNLGIDVAPWIERYHETMATEYIVALGKELTAAITAKEQELEDEEGAQ